MFSTKNLKLAEEVIGPAYLKTAEESNHSRSSEVTKLLSQRRLPDHGWSDVHIQLFLSELAAMDSNNFLHNAGVGEREARIYNDLVRKRHFGFGHGIGRAGDIAAVQPKAAGSSLILQLTNYMVRDALQIAGIKAAKHCLCLPMATGMAMATVLQALKKQRPSARKVIWTRVDQKSCLKSILTVGCEPIIVNNKIQDDEVITDVEGLEQALLDSDLNDVLCVVTTTSCFAPRAPDAIVKVARLCRQKCVPHIVNNAYGLQSRRCANLLSEASATGRVDVFVQSTDKNFMVPVGGSIIASSSPEVLDIVRSDYPGRASMAPILDMFITLLSMGRTGYQNLLKEREELFSYFRDRLRQVAESFGERLLNTKGNLISAAITLDKASNPTELGSMLFARCVSGTRVVVPHGEKNVCGHTFLGYGSHGFPTPYLSAACAIGATKKDIIVFIDRLEHVLSHEYAKPVNRSPSSEFELVHNPTPTSPSAAGALSLPHQQTLASNAQNPSQTSVSATPDGTATAAVGPTQSTCVGSQIALIPEASQESQTLGSPSKASQTHKEQACSRGSQAIRTGDSKGSQVQPCGESKGSQASQKAESKGSQVSQQAESKSSQACGLSESKGSQATLRGESKSSQVTRRSEAKGCQAVSTASSTGSQASQQMESTACQAVREPSTLSPGPESPCTRCGGSPTPPSVQSQRSQCVTSTASSGSQASRTVSGESKGSQASHAKASQAEPLPFTSHTKGSQAALTYESKSSQASRAQVSRSSQASALVRGCHTSTASQASQPNQSTASQATALHPSCASSGTSTSDTTHCRGTTTS
eukprot:Rmarinus@m.21036